MFEIYYFILGIINNILLTSIFLIVKFAKMPKLKEVGIAYLSLAVPAVFGIFIALQQNKPIQYVIFLCIFIAFLIIEGVYDFVLKIEFRKNWKQLVPFLALYWSMNYGFCVMTWKNSVVQGSIILGLFITQLIANLLSHTK